VSAVNAMTRWPVTGGAAPSLQRASLLIGIDPGATTGYAEWCCASQRLVTVESMLIHQAMARVRERLASGGLRAVVWEDARLRTWFGAKGREALQGAGSIKRDCGIWEAYLEDLGCTAQKLKPQAGGTKWPADRFTRLTGWAGRTNEHARDAAMLVYGRKS